jgi:uncharacterized membrane protein YozB (DUF420 family)
MEFNGAVKKRQAAIAFVLGVASLVAVFISLLALADIYHGESDLRLEWMVLRICFAVIFIFQVFALVTFWRMIRKENPGAGKG